MIMACLSRLFQTHPSRGEQKISTLAEFYERINYNDGKELGLGPAAAEA